MSDGQLLPVMAEEPIPFVCGNSEQFGDGSPIFLANKRPKWWLRDELPWMSRAELEATIQAALDAWAAVCDVKASRADDAASCDFLVTVASIDGPGRVLADMQLPSPGLRPQLMRIDMAESALRPLLLAILTHEFGHAFGLQHFPQGPPPELMEPALSPSVTTPQPTESALMMKWYGPPQPVAPPTGPDGPLPAGPLVCTMRVADVSCTAKVTPGDLVVQCDIDVQKGGKRATLSGSKPW